MMVVIMESLWFQVPALLGIAIFVVTLSWELLAFMLRFLLAADQANAPDKLKVPYLFDSGDDRYGFSMAIVIGGILAGSLLHFIQWVVLLAPFEIMLSIVVAVLVFSIRFLFGAMYDHNDRIVRTEGKLGIKSPEVEVTYNNTEELLLALHYNKITQDEFYNLMRKL
jgi:hypothetical protein